MPIVPGNPQFPMQYGWNNSGVQPYTTQLNFGQMIGEVLLWAPDVDPLLVGRIINNQYRKIIEYRNWYGLMVRGQVTTPQQYSQGTATATFGSNTVQGIGTGWTVSQIGLQFREGFTNPWQTIVSVNEEAQTLQLDMPFGGQTITSGYQIVRQFITLGANVRYLLDAVNQFQGYRMKVNVPQQTINEIDTWRTSVGWSLIFSNLPPTPDGQMQWEVWPSPFFQQVFPFLAYTQPPNLVNDQDCPVTFIRSDVLVMMAISDVLVFRGKTNKYYDPPTAQLKMAQAMRELDAMSRNDDSMYQSDTTWSYGWEYGYNAGQGSLFSQSRLVGGGGGGNW